MKGAPLLDTHAWIWWLHGDPRLGRHVIDSLDALPADTRPAISDISLWEVATLVSLGRLELKSTLDAWLAIAANPKTVRVLPITSRIAAEIARLPDTFHRDPADRIIVATSRVHGLPILTKDVAIAKSGLARLWLPDHTKEAALREMLPRIFELKDLVEDPAHPNAYFQDFEATARQNPSKLNAFLKLESQLTPLDSGSWQDLMTRAAEYLVSRQRERGRGWQQLFDTLNEAKAFGYLIRIGCVNVRFVPRADDRTPDLSASHEGAPLLCEVKTLNISDDQASRNQRVSDGEVLATKVATRLPDGFLENKLAPTIDRAHKQLAEHDPNRLARWIVFLVLNFDDSLGDYDEEYFRQIDEYLADHPCAKAELVFAPATNNFERNLSMGSATVYLG